MAFILKTAIKLSSAWIIKYVESDAFKTYVVSKLNKEIDIPKLNENEEQELFNKIYTMIVNSIKGFVK
jgi:hypothetical protein